MTSTLPAVTDAATVRRSRDQRRAGVVLLALFVLAGALGQLGTRTTETTARAGDWSLVVTHPATSRPGHAVKVEFEIRKRGGFDTTKPVRVRFLSKYFDLFDENAFTPQPDAETADGDYTVDEFVPPEGEVLLVSVDTRVEPARQRGERGEVAVVDEDGRPLVVASFRTRIFP